MIKKPFKLGYLILAHDRIDLVDRLINRLGIPNVYFFVHIDKKCKEDYTILLNRENVFVLDSRQSVEWGDISVVNAILRLSLFALKAKQDCDYFVLLSGHDYPVKNAYYIYDYINRNKSRNYIGGGYKLPSKEISWTLGGLLRTHGYALRLSKNRIVSILPRSVSFVNFKQVANVLRYDGKKVFDAVRLFFKKKRIFPCKLFPYGGELWFRINRATLSGIMEFINLNPQYHDYMETVAVPDEIYFNTLICNLYNYQGSNLTFINWTGGNSPEWIDDKSIIEEKISNPRILFARKFNSNHILNFIDKEIGG